MTTSEKRPVRRRRGSALVIVMLAMLVMATFAASFVSQTATDMQGATPYWQVLSALYAAEAGLEMSLQELSNESDVDGDGTVGSIAQRQVGDMANVTTAVAVATDGDDTVLTATGKTDDTERVVEIRIQ